MAIISRKQSDLSGEEGADDKFATVVVRQHPGLKQPKVLDVTVDELKLFEEIDGVVILEIKLPDGKTQQRFVRLADFNNAVPDDVLKKARGTRGRLPGQRPRRS